jgi:Cu+-exporting ATPase
MEMGSRQVTQTAKVGLDTGGAVQPGREATLRFNLTDAVTGQPVDAVVAHEKQMHLIVASRDLGYFAHLHPEQTGKVGEYEVVLAFPSAGDYVLYDEFELAGRGDEVHRFDLRAGASGSEAAQLAVDMGPKQAGEYTARIGTGDEITAGKESSFVVSIEESGKPITDIEPYLGAAAHVVVLDQNASGFAHVHAVAGNAPPTGEMEDMGEPPARFGPDLAFSHRFEKQGLYKVWVQFNRGGEVTTVDWVVEVR